MTPKSYNIAQTKWDAVVYHVAETAPTALTVYHGASYHSGGNDYLDRSITFIVSIMLHYLKTEPNLYILLSNEFPLI